MISANTAAARHGQLSREHHDAVSDGSHLDLIGEMGPAKNDPVKNNPYEKTERYATLGVVHLDGAKLVVSDLKVPKMLEAEAVEYAEKNQANTMFSRGRGGRPETVVVAVPQGVDYRKPDDVINASIALMRQGRADDDKTPTALETILGKRRARPLATHQNQPTI